MRIAHDSAIGAKPSTTRRSREANQGRVRPRRKKHDRYDSRGRGPRQIAILQASVFSGSGGHHSRDRKS
ncbi:MAG TPA: hypothetical protein DCW88_14290, partial [Agrobacterium sp.]|nr:hypothetical protein [Agrobacterium sp.]